MKTAADITKVSAISSKNRYRLRTFVDELARNGELQIVEKPVDLAEIGSYLDGNPKAVLFRAAGPDRVEVVGNVAGSRSRLALAFGVSEQELRQETVRRLKKPDSAGGSVECRCAGS